MSPRRPRGFTLVELLVVIAIIGIMLAMAIPAIQAARESARRKTCEYNLARIGMALKAYQAAYEMLPAGVLNPQGPIRSEPVGYHMGWLVQLLPYMEEKVTYGYVDLGASVYDAKNEPVRTLRLPILLCPTDSGVFLEAANSAAPTSYAGCHHDVEAPIDADNHGVLFLNSHLRAEDIPDGQSHTLFVAEKRYETGDLGWMSGTRASLRNTGWPPNRSPEERPPVAAPAGKPGAKPAPPDSEKQKLFVGGFGSWHSGLINAMMGDGSVEAITDEIDPQVFRQLGNRADGQLVRERPF